MFHPLFAIANARRHEALRRQNPAASPRLPKIRAKKWWLAWVKRIRR